jgi:hypothetical protein
MPLCLWVDAMKKRSKVGAELSKGRRRNTQEPIGNAPKVVARSKSSSRDEPEVARLTRELNGALERQAATSQVFEIISGSPGVLQLVFVALLKNAVRLCDANFGILWLSEGAGFRCVALHNAPGAFSEDFQRRPVVYPPLAVCRASGPIARKIDLITDAGQFVPGLHHGGSCAGAVLHT